jgi:lipoprotein-anchoring transpeptidase ErfK/SrfK
MPDYYSIVWRALKKGDSANAQWRNNVFDRTRQMLLDQLRTWRPPHSSAEIRLHTDALEAAIKAIQSEFAQNGGRDGVDAEPRLPPQGELAGGSLTPADTGPNAPPFWFNRIVWVAVAVVVAAVVAGVYAFQATRHSSQAPPASKAEAANDRAAPRPPPLKRRPGAATSADGDLAPGVDGGSTDAEVPFVFRRQPVFYRTTHPVGTIIIDKQQHFLYLIQPNLVALRYGIGVGKSCADVAGLRRVSSKVEWPEWQPPAQMVERKLASGALDEEECFIDATFVMAKGGGAEIGATKRGKGMKIMAIVDRNGLPLSVSTHAANHHEVRLVQLCFDFYMIEAKPENLIGDRAYDSDPLEAGGLTGARGNQDQDRR